jgi:nucleotide-binding universal stress UspA family protein
VPAQVQLTLNPLGIIFAAVFAFSIAALLWWMLHPPKMVGLAVAAAHRGVSAAKRILVPTKGSYYCNRAVELACRLGMEQDAEIVVAHVIEVPLALPLGTPLPAMEQKGNDALAQATDIVNLHNLKPVTRLERDRTVQRGVLRVAMDMSADLVVMGINPKRVAAGQSISRVVESILRRAGIEVIMDVIPEGEEL